MREPCGILLVDKPEGPTSRQVAETVGARLRQGRGRPRRGQRRFRVGHAGTLDPLATGLLVILVGRATRLAPFLQGLDKRYLATIRFGTATDSHDRMGEVTARSDPPRQLDELERVLASLQRTVQQVPPVISSLKRGGRSLHRLAREGREVAEPEARPVRIDRLVATAERWGAAPAADASGHLAPDGRLYEIDLDITCGSGTYVRSLARDVAHELGTLGHVQALRRLVVGPFAVEQAVPLAALEAATAPAGGLRPLADALPHLPAFTLTLAQASRVRHGGQPEDGWLPEPAPAQFRLLDPAGRLAAVGRRDSPTGRAVTVVVFPDEGAMTIEAEPCE